MQRLILCGALATAVACGASISRDLIENHPSLDLDVVRPRTVETSEPMQPAWLRTPQRDEVGAVAFVGQAAGRELDAARAAALDDARASIASFISVDVESEFESKETYKQKGEKVEQSIEVTSTVRSHASATVRKITAVATYWEKIVASPVTPDNVSYRFYVQARVPRAEILRARLEKQSARQKESGRTLVVVLPFRAVADSADLKLLARAFLEELSRRLGVGESLYVSDPTLVSALVGFDATTSEAEAIETVRDALLPDLIVGGSYQLHKGSLRVTYSLYDVRTGDKVRAQQITRPFNDLFGLQDQLIASIQKDLAGVVPEMKPGEAKPPVRGSHDAYQLYHQAYAAFAAGNNDGALEQLGRAVELSPEFARAFMRMGRVLERLGRYGRLPALAAGDISWRDWLPQVCTPWKDLSGADYVEFLAAREMSGDAEVAPWELDAVNVDHIMSAVAYVIAGGPAPRVVAQPVPVSAAGAYYRGLRLATEAGDERGVSDAFVALADLGVRVDRLDAAEAIYQQLTARASGSGDVHTLSLAYLGLGRIAVRRAQYSTAAQWFESALVERVRLGEKPYLLEIFNELGNLAVQRGDYRLAAYHFRRARRIAEDLDNDYFRAVLSNNLGVLAYLRGDTAWALGQFERAWEFLADLEEAEGQLAAGLNIGLTSVTRGDVERAAAYLEIARQIVGRTHQEGNLALVYAHRGAHAASAGQSHDALRALLRGWSLFRQLGRPSQALRLRNNISVADFGAFAAAALDDDEDESLGRRVRCLQHAFGDMLERGFGISRWEVMRRPWGYWRYYWREEPQERWRGEPPPLVYLITRLNAETLARVSP